MYKIVLKYSGKNTYDVFIKQHTKANHESETTRIGANLWIYTKSK